MKKKFKFFALLCFLLLTILSAHPVMAAEATTQGDAAMQLASILGLDTSSQANAIAALQALGISPPGGWNVNAPVTSTFVGQVYSAVSSAISAGRVTAPPGLGNASAIAAATFTAIGMPSSTVVNSIVSAGGDRSSANIGASQGTSLALSSGGAGEGASGEGGGRTGTIGGDTVSPGGTTTGTSGFSPHL